MAQHHAHLSPDGFVEHAEALREHHAGMMSWGIRDGHYLQWMKGVSTDAKILEIGAGSGALAAKLQEQGWKNIFLADIDNYLSVPSAKQLSFVRWNANTDRLPFENGSLDVVFALQIVEHLENVWHATREMARVLRVGGRCIISLPEGLSLISRFRFLLSGNVMGYDEKNDHIAFFPRAVWKKMIDPSFKTIQVDWSEPFLKLGKRKLRFPRWPFLQRCLSRKVCYVLERIERQEVVPEWKPFGHIASEERDSGTV